MKRPDHTLEGYLGEQLNMSVSTFIRAVGMSRPVMNRYWNQNRRLVKLLIAGYRVEVRKETIE